MKTMSLKVIGNQLITVHGTEQVTEQEGRECLDVLKGMDVRKIRALVFTRGGAPAPAQRKALADAYRGRAVPTAILSDVRFIRGVATAMSWFNPSLRSFSAEAIEDALKYLDVPREEWSAVQREFRRMIWEMDQKTAKATG
jgi:hypothetical protein